MVYLAVPTPLGQVYICQEGTCITALGFAQPLAGTAAKTPLLMEARVQLDAYFAGRRQAFSLPLCPSGTDFQKKVWKQLQKIPYGVTITYGELACRVGCPKGARAVGSACGKNPIGILTMAPGGFFVFGCMIALINKISKGKAIKKKEFGCAGCPGCGKGACEGKEAAAK